MSDKSRPQSFKDLLVWQKGMRATQAVYEITRGFPGDERFSLTLQMRRAAVSIPSNIAEGQARRSTREFAYFLSNAQGSVAESLHATHLGRKARLL